jgi:hypothetical protein
MSPLTYALISLIVGVLGLVGWAGLFILKYQERKEEDREYDPSKPKIDFSKIKRMPI